MKRLKAGVAIAAFCAISFTGTAFTAEPASAEDDLCRYLFAKRQVLFMMVDVFGLNWRDVSWEVHDVDSAIGSEC